MGDFPCLSAPIENFVHLTTRKLKGGGIIFIALLALIIGVLVLVVGMHTKKKWVTWIALIILLMPLWELVKLLLIILFTFYSFYRFWS